MLNIISYIVIVQFGQVNVSTKYDSHALDEFVLKRVMTRANKCA
jgi:hypothetical protein